MKAFYEQTEDAGARERIEAYHHAQYASYLAETRFYGYNLEYDRASALWKMDWKAAE